MVGKMLLEFCDENELCVENTCFKKGEKREESDVQRRRKWD